MISALLQHRNGFLIIARLYPLLRTIPQQRRRLRLLRIALQQRRHPPAHQLRRNRRVRPLRRIRNQPVGRLDTLPMLPPSWPLVVLTDDAARAARSEMNFLWTTFTRFEPAADIHAAERRIVRNHIAYAGPVVIDARMKPWYPKELSADPDTAALVTRRWKDYFPSGKVAMGDSERAHLD